MQQHLSFNEWMSWNLRKKNSSNSRICYLHSVDMARRNKLIFENVEPETRAKAEVITRYALTVDSTMSNRMLVRGEQGVYHTRWVGWLLGDFGSSQSQKLAHEMRLSLILINSSLTHSTTDVG